MSRVSCRVDLPTPPVDEACKLLKNFAGEVVSANPPQGCLDAIAEYDRDQARRFPAYVPR